MLVGAGARSVAGSDYGIGNRMHALGAGDGATLSARGRERDKLMSKSTCRDRTKFNYPIVPGPCDSSARDHEVFIEVSNVIYACSSFGGASLEVSRR